MKARPQDVVLVFAQDPILVARLARHLRAHGFGAFSATSVAEGLSLMQLLQPKVVVLNPTSKEGYALLHDSTSSWETMRIVAMVDSEVSAQKAREMGIEEVIMDDDPRSVVDEVSLLLHEEPLSLESVGTRILVVDDEAEILEVLSELLSRRGYPVVTASSGPEALDIIDHDAGIGLVLLDVILPSMGGIETLKELKRRHRQLHVIMISAMADAVIALQAVELGAFDFILKPIDPEALEARIIACIAAGDFHQLRWWKRFGATP